MTDKIYHNYSFKVDGGLNVFARAESEKVAYERIYKAWPRSKIELVGVDMPETERTHARPDPIAKKTPIDYDDMPKLGSVAKPSARKTKKTEMDKLGLTDTEASLVANFV